MYKCIFLRVNGVEFHYGDISVKVFEEFHIPTNVNALQLFQKTVIYQRHWDSVLDVNANDQAPVNIDISVLLADETAAPSLLEVKNEEAVELVYKTLWTFLPYPHDELYNCPEVENSVYSYRDCSKPDYIEGMKRFQKDFDRKITSDYFEHMLSDACRPCFNLRKKYAPLEEIVLQNLQKLSCAIVMVLVYC